MPLFLAPWWVLCLLHFVQLPELSVLREKRKWNGAKPKAPNEKWFILDYKTLTEEPKIHTCISSHTKPRHNLGPLFKSSGSFWRQSSRKHGAQKNHVRRLYKIMQILFYRGRGLWEWEGAGSPFFFWKRLILARQRVLWIFFFFSKIWPWKSLLGFSGCISISTLIFKILTCFVPLFSFIS